jgi:4-hydroxy-tetrahydrodipicolinate synthase
MGTERNCISEEDDMDQTSEGQMCRNRGTATPKYIASLSAMNHVPLATLTGYASALPTPFKGEDIDEEAFARFCDWQIGEGISALVVAGTTGEAPTLSMAEHRRLLRIATETADGRVSVLAGAGANATAHAIELARQAEQEGADGLLVVTPYYNRPPQEGLYRHFRAIHDATGLPILLYDVPSRTACALATETILRLAELPRIVGLKDAADDLMRPVQLRRQLGERFRLFTGDDATVVEFLAAGGDGCISVVSNLVPALCEELHSAWTCGNDAGARGIARILAPLTAALFAESNPIPVKWALKLLGFMSAELRLPLCEASDTTRVAVAEVLSRLDLMRPAPQNSERSKSTDFRATAVPSWA